MKYVIFICAVLLLVPAGAIAASQSRRIREVGFVLMLVSTGFIDRYDINFVYRGWYHAPTRGLEISFVDLLALILLFSTLASMRREGTRLYWPASLGLMSVFVGYCCVSVMLFDPRIFGTLELFKLLRGLLAFLAVAFYVRSERDVYVFIIAMSAILLYEGTLSVLQRYFLGYMRVQGSFVHPSALADYCCTTAPLLLSVCFSQTKRLIQGGCALAWALACVATILSVTRMGIMAFMIASAGVLIVALAAQMTPKNLALVVACGLVGCGLFLRGYHTMAERNRAMVAAEEAGDAGSGRKVYYIAAWNMAEENPFGVGLNNWSWWLSARNGCPYENMEDGGGGTHEIMAHSAFALTLGELGWPGFLIFMALWLRWLTISGRYLLSRPRDIQARLLVGCFFSTIAAALAALTEHNFRNQLFYIFFNIMLGLMAALHQMQRTRTLRRTAEPGWPR